MYLSEGLLQSYLSDAPDSAPMQELISCMRMGASLNQAIHTDPHADPSAADVLCRDRLLYPDDATMLIHVIFQPGIHFPLPMDMPKEQLEQLLECQRLFRLLCNVHLFHDAGRLLILLHHRPNTSVPPAELHHVLTLILHRLPDVDRIIASEWKENYVDLFHAYNSIIRFEEYQNFIQTPARIQYVEQNAQMAIPFEEHSHHFDCLSRDITAAMLQPSFDSGYWSLETVALILESAVGSVEALHRCIQIFVSSLSRCLVESRVLASRDVDQGEMLDTAMQAVDNAQMLQDAIDRLLQILYRRHRTFDDRAGAKRVRAVCDYIAAHISDYGLGIPTLCQYCGINRNLLASDFKKYTGSSLSNYLTEARVNYAKELMQTHPAMSLAEIAARSGYASLSTMYRNFQKVAGCSPGDVRAQLSGNVIP